MDKEKKVIHIDWEGPVALDDISKYDGASDYGVYQAYGAHPIYGDNVLLYIGRVVHQTFAQRMKQHGFAEWSHDPTRVELYLGRFAGESFPGGDKWNKQIESAEALLIFSHAPAWNSQNIQDFDAEKVNNIHVVNWGNRRSLFPEVSSYRWDQDSLAKPSNLSVFKTT